MAAIKSAFKPFVDEFEKIGSQTASQAVQAVKQVASDVVAKPIQETVGTKVMGPAGAGTNEDAQGTQQQMTKQQMAKMQADDQTRAQQQMVQIRQNLKALMTPAKPPPEKPIYYKIWEEMEKKKQEKAEEEYKENKDKAEVAALKASSTAEQKKGIGG
jgi:hypothetical protein